LNISSESVLTVKFRLIFLAYLIKDGVDGYEVSIPPRVSTR